MGLTLLVLLVQDIPLSAYLRQVETDRLVTSLERDAFVLAGRSEDALENPTSEGDAMLTELARTYRDSGGARVVIANRAGIAVVTSDDDQLKAGSSYLSRPEISAALEGTITSGSRYSQTLEQQLLFVAVPVLSGGSVLGAVRLTYPEDVVTHAVTSRLSVLGTIALTSVLLAGVAGLIFSTSVTRRLRLLEAVTEVLANGDLTARADETIGAPEIRALSRSFNSMADRLSAMIEQQRSFAADASHQLRTPLTALRLRLESAHELVTSDPETAASRLAAAENEADRLLTIIEGLLLLSRVESGGIQRTPIDLAAVAEARAGQWAALAGDLGVSIRLAVGDPTIVFAVPTSIEQVIDNFVDNALTAAHAGDEIMIEVTRSAGTATVSVVDHGPGLTVDQRAHAFDRFWQADSDGSGSGLGLAVVKQLVAASGGDAWLTPNEPHGLSAHAMFSTIEYESVGRRV